MSFHNFSYRMSVVRDLFDVPEYPRPYELRAVHCLSPKEFLALQCYMLGVDAPASSGMAYLHGAALRALPKVVQIANLQQIEWLLCVSLAWMFPPHMSWGRTNRFVLEITSLVDAVAGLLVMHERQLLPPSACASRDHVLLLSRFFHSSWQRSMLHSPTQWGHLHWPDHTSPCWLVLVA